MQGHLAKMGFEEAAGVDDWHTRGYLPHYEEAQLQFITYRLANSLLQGKLKPLEVDQLTTRPTGVPPARKKGWRRGPDSNR